MCVSLDLEGGQLFPNLLMCNPLTLHLSVTFTMFVGLLMRMLGFTPVQVYGVQYEWISETKSSIYKG